MRYLFLGLLSLTLSSCSALLHTPPQISAARLQAQQNHQLQPRAVTSIPVDEARRWLANPKAQWLLLDLRDASAYQQGHLSHAVSMPLIEPGFSEKLLNMNRHQPTIIYSQTGQRSQVGLETMRSLGFRNVYTIKGGLNAWLDAGYPLN
ncbi:MAG: rhodanese-like domain-containing protein [Candidatus Sericytochromatia bacterium]|nr:rhodanese-like domain-containing protein [Candidatus Sericytochromatia bacterium]